MHGMDTIKVCLKTLKNSFGPYFLNALYKDTKFRKPVLFPLISSIYFRESSFS